MALKFVPDSSLVRDHSQRHLQVDHLWLSRLGLSLGQRRNQQAQAGFTLIEALIAMLVVAIVMVAVTPPIFMVTATRIQQRKAQQALQLAQGEIDRVRTLVERGSYAIDNLPSVVTDLSNASVGSSYGPASKNYKGEKLPSTEFLQVDVTGDGVSDFLLQSFRTAGPDETTTSPPTGFRMGVRVYADTPALRANLSALQKERASLKMTSGLGEQTVRPLAVLYSTIVRSDKSTALREYKKLCPSTTGC